MIDFRITFQDKPVPEVDVAALRWFWKLLFPNSYAQASFPPVTISVSEELLREGCGPSTDINGLYVRCALLAQMVHAGLLMSWQKQGQLDLAVTVMATYHISDVDHFDPDAFSKRLEEIAPPLG